MGLNPWESMREKWEEACNNQHTDLGRQSSYLWCQIIIPVGGVDHVQHQIGCTLTRERDRVQICLIWILQGRVLSALVASLPMSGQGADSEPHPLWGIFGSHLNRRAGSNSWKPRSPVTLELRDGQTKLMVCRAKPVALISQLSYDASWLELRQQRALLTLEILLPLYLGQ